MKNIKKSDSYPCKTAENLVFYCFKVLIHISCEEIIQKTHYVKGPAELHGGNLRERNALQIVDRFDSRGGVTLRLTAVYMDYSGTHLGIALDAPYQDWNVAEVNIMDDQGRTYWVSISRGEETDPFFPVRISTDCMPDDVRELLVSVRRVYLSDRPREEDLQESLSVEEKSIYNRIPSLGDRSAVSTEIKDINRKLRELEMRRFFQFPIIREEIRERWTFTVPLDFSFRKRIHRVYRLDNRIKIGCSTLRPLVFKTGIIRNELVCEYQNPHLERETLIAVKSREPGEDIVFLETSFSPVMPEIALFDPRDGTEYPPRGKNKTFFRGAGKLILTKDNKLKIYYQFEPRDYDLEGKEILIKGLEFCLDKSEKVKLFPGEEGETFLDVPIYSGDGLKNSRPLKVKWNLMGDDVKVNWKIADIAYENPQGAVLNNFWITRCLMIAGRIIQQCSPGPVKGEEENGLQRHCRCRFMTAEKQGKIYWKPLACYYDLDTPSRTKLKVVSMGETQDLEKELDGGIVIMPGNPAEIAP